MVFQSMFGKEILLQLSFKRRDKADCFFNSAELEAGWAVTFRRRLLLSVKVLPKTLRVDSTPKKQVQNAFLCKYCEACSAYRRAVLAPFRQSHLPEHFAY